MQQGALAPAGALGAGAGGEQAEQYRLAQPLAHFRVVQQLRGVLDHLVHRGQQRAQPGESVGLGVQAVAAAQRGLQVVALGDGGQLGDGRRAHGDGHHVQRRRRAEVQLLPWPEGDRHIGLDDLGAEAGDPLLVHGHDEGPGAFPGVAQLVHALVGAFADYLQVIDPALGDAALIATGAELIVDLFPAAETGGLVVDVGGGVVAHQEPG
ncbi:hypothetical protein D3C78_545630 [compost metagenome]